MSTICRKDGRACPDDVCIGSGTCLRTGTAVLERCMSCGEVYDPEYGVDCACEPEPYIDEFEATGGQPSGSGQQLTEWWRKVEHERRR